MAVPNPDRWSSGWANANSTDLSIDCVEDDIIVVACGSSSAGATPPPPDSPNLGTFGIFEQMFFTFIHPTFGPLPISLGMFYAPAPTDLTAEDITIYGGAGDDYIFGTVVAYSSVDHGTLVGAVSDSQNTGDTSPSIYLPGSGLTDDSLVIAGLACIPDETVTPGADSDEITEVSVTGLATQSQMCQDHASITGNDETIDATLGAAADWGMIAVELLPATSGPPPPAISIDNTAIGNNDSGDTADLAALSTATENDLILVAVLSGDQGTAPPGPPTSPNLTFTSINAHGFGFTGSGNTLELYLYAARANGLLDSEVITIYGGDTDDWVTGVAVAYINVVDYEQLFWDAAEGDATPHLNGLVPSSDGSLLIMAFGEEDQTYSDGAAVDTAASNLAGPGVIAIVQNDHFTDASVSDSIDVSMLAPGDWLALSAFLIPGTPEPGPPPTGDDPPLDDIYSMIL